MPKRTVERTVEHDAILSAHIQYELAQFTPAAVAATIGREVNALYDWLGSVTVGDLVGPDQLLALLRRALVERPLPAEIGVFLQENATIALELVQDEPSPLHLFVPEPVVQHVIENVAAMQDVRQQVTHRIVRSSIYSRLISNVLYHGIKSFLLSEHGVARAIPGAGVFVRLGQNALNSAAPQLEKNVDKQLLTFIHDNIQQLIADSETFLNRTLDEELIHKAGDELWETLKDEPLATLTAAIDKQSVGGWSEVAEELWQHGRTTPLFDDALQAVVRSFFLRYGKRPVADVLGLLGLDQEIAAQELQVLIEPIAQQALATGYLEARIRARLEPFYRDYFQAADPGQA